MIFDDFKMNLSSRKKSQRKIKMLEKHVERAQLFEKYGQKACTKLFHVEMRSLKYSENEGIDFTFF